MAAVSLRCNFDNQSLVYLPPASTLPLEWLPNIGAQSQMAWMAQTKGDLEAKWFVPLAGAVRKQAAETAESVSRTQLLVGGAVCTQPAETAVGNEIAETVSGTQLLVGGVQELLLEMKLQKVVSVLMSLGWKTCCKRWNRKRKVLFKMHTTKGITSMNIIQQK